MFVIFVQLEMFSNLVLDASAPQQLLQVNDGQLSLLLPLKLNAP